MKRKINCLILMSVLMSINNLAVGGYMVNDSYTVGLWNMDSRSTSKILDLDTVRANNFVLYGGAAAFTFPTSYDGSEAIYFNGLAGTEGNRAISDLWDTNNDQLKFQACINPAQIEAASANTFFHINQSVGLATYEGKFRLTVYGTSSSSVLVETSAAYNNNTWYSVEAIVNSDGSFSLSVSDMLTGSETVSGSTGIGSWNVVASQMFLGASRWNTQHFEGMLDDVKISAIPEPATFALLFSGVGGLMLRSRKRN